MSTRHRALVLNLLVSLLTAACGRYEQIERAIEAISQSP
jgi:hypothetical protein